MNQLETNKKILPHATRYGAGLLVATCLLSTVSAQVTSGPALPTPGTPTVTSPTSDTPPITTLATEGSADPVVERVPDYVRPTEAALRQKLSRRQYEVTQNEATEPPRRNRYWDSKMVGLYECIVCGQDLFDSDTKFKSGTGWPSFYAPLSEKHVGAKTDYHLGYARTEVHCSRCKAHLGHVFSDGPQPTGRRYCMNSASLNFVERNSENENSGGNSGKNSAKANN